MNYKIAKFKVKSKSHEKIMMILAIVMGWSILSNFAVAASAMDVRGMKRYYGLDIPNDTSATPKAVIRNRVEMKTSEREVQYKDTQVKKYERGRILGEIFDAAVLMTPVTRVIRPIDTIGVSPAYITQIVFPPGMEITDAISSFRSPLLEYGKNLLRFRPDPRDFVAGNIVISLKDNHKTYSMAIFVERYYQRDCRVDGDRYICRKVRGTFPASKSDGKVNYAYSYNNLSAYYTYIDPVKIDDLEAIEMYEKVSGKILSITRDGDSVSFNYQGIDYTITRDEGYDVGTISYRGRQYRVSSTGNSSIGN